MSSLDLTKFIDKALHDPKNLATEIELTEHANSALAAFREVDVDSSESLSIPELVSLCSHMGLPMENDEEEALMKIDADDSGQISIEEWLVWWLKRVSCLPNPLKQQEAIAKNTFKKFDIDNSGSLDISELDALIASLGAKFSEDEMKEVVKQLDTDGSGIVELGEFLEWWVQRSSKSRSGGGLIAMKLRKLARKAAQLFFTDIFTAVWNNDINLVKAFLESDRRIGSASDVSEYGDGWMPLHYASYRGHLAIVEELLADFDRDPVNVNGLNDLGFSPLFYACQCGHHDICKLLLEKGADPSISGSSPELGHVMCPVDHSEDDPVLKKMFQAHKSCSPPTQPPADKMTASIIESKGLLSIDLPPLRTFSILPVKKWRVVVTLSSSAKNSFEITVDGLDPNKARSGSGNILAVSIERKWVISNLRPDGSLPDLTVRLSAVNSLGAVSPYSDDVDITRDASMTKSASNALAGSTTNENPNATLADIDENEEEDLYDDNFDQKEEKDDFNANDDTIERLRREINGDETEEEDEVEELVIVKENQYK